MGDAGNHARLAALIRDEMASLERVIEELAALPSAPGSIAPKPLELRGAAAIVHDFYTGIERIAERIAAQFDGGVPPGPSWHRELLRAVSLELPGARPAVLRRPTAHSLDEFLRFRHLFRNVYGFELEWDRLRPLLAAAPACWVEVRADLEAFLAFLEGLS